MSEVAIHVEGLSKRYRIGAQQLGYKTLKEKLTQTAATPFRALKSLAGRNGHNSKSAIRNSKSDLIWALKDVSFEIKRGEVVGIIGRNGAGKSTLLKILSRITEPTEGYADITGRIASLLEVGTGFQPELTGRENIYLNGSILGMKYAEIRRRFDEIVAFAEVEKFIDTPVKHYSSGMYVRLAFGVAAHLDPEILLVDEVLAVGDAAFQKKCLGKMGDVAREGRTVLFVSHNMEAILKLCTRGILMTSGQIAQCGAVSGVITSYLEGHLSTTTVVNLRDRSRPAGATGKARLVGVLPSNDRQGWSFAFGQGLSFDVQLEARQPLENVELGIGLFSARGFEVASWTSTYSGVTLPAKPGLNTIRVNYQDLSLLPGQYWLDIGLRSDRGSEDYVPEAVLFEIVVSKSGADANAHTFGGIIVPSVAAHMLR